LSAWVVACHVVMLFQYRVLIQEPDKLHETETSVFFVGARGMGMQVDGFFAISGFLLVYPLLEQIHSRSSSDGGGGGGDVDGDGKERALESAPGTHMFEHVSATSVCAYALVKRLVRMWPPLTVTIVLCLLMGDHNIYSLSTVLGLYSFPTFAMDIPVTFGLLWSCRVDIMAGVLLTLLCAKTPLLKGGHVENGMLVFVASLAPKLVAFFANYPAWSYLAKVPSTNTHPHQNLPLLSQSLIIPNTRHTLPRHAQGRSRSSSCLSSWTVTSYRGCKRPSLMPSRPTRRAIPLAHSRQHSCRRSTS